MYGNVFVEQKYDGGWQAPQAYISLDTLTDLGPLNIGDPGSNDAQYNVFTFWEEQYNEIDCLQTVNPASSKAQPAAGRTPVDGKVILASTVSTIATNFAYPEPANPAGYDAPINNIFNTVVEINLQSDSIAQLLGLDDPIVLGCCKLQRAS